jgi:hypothetical protein
MIIPALNGLSEFHAAAVCHDVERLLRKGLRAKRLARDNFSSEIFWSLWA